MASEPDITLNPDLNRTAIAARLQSHRRVQIHDVFPDNVARQLLSCLQLQVPWNTTFNDDGGKVHTLHPIQTAALTPQKTAVIQQHILGRATSQFQFHFKNYPVWDLWAQNRGSDLYIFKLVRFLNSPAFLALIHEISGIPGINMADAQATLFQAGHFLSGHTDAGTPELGRRLAYVLNLTPVWRPEWGGALEFIDPDGNIEAGFTPAFNTLNLFFVPCPHHVSYVAPFAGGGRYSVTGWLRETRASETGS